MKFRHKSRYANKYSFITVFSIKRDCDRIIKHILLYGDWDKSGFYYMDKSEVQSLYQFSDFYFDILVSKLIDDNQINPDYPDKLYLTHHGKVFAKGSSHTRKWMYKVLLIVSAIMGFVIALQKIISMILFKQ